MSTVLNPDKVSNSTNGRSISSESNMIKLILDDPHRQASSSLTSPRDTKLRDKNNNIIYNVSNTAISTRSSVNDDSNGNAVTSAQASNTSTTSKIILAKQEDAPLDKMNSVNQAAEPATQSPRKNSSSIAKFKEKRPEPLKLNPNINQEIPLDLSVKSAGNVPSGRGCIFNLALSGHQMATLETPRIQWQDNESFLSAPKSRLFSTSTTTNHRARLSSIMGDSSPITPGSSFMDLMANPNQGISVRTCHPPNLTAASERDGPNKASPSKLGKYQLLDKLSQTNGSLMRYNQLRNEIRGTPRRSCSTDSLNYFCIRGPIELNRVHKGKIHLSEDVTTDVKMDTNDNSRKKNSISPLAIKSLSNIIKDPNIDSGKFSYTMDNQMLSDDSLDSTSPTMANMINNKSVTPISIANATANLLNIHLNSPTRNSELSPTASIFEANSVNTNNLHQQLQHNHYQNPSISSLSDFLAASQRSHPEPSPLDPLLSAAHCQQLIHRPSLASSSASSPAEQQQQLEQRNSLLHNSYLSQQNTPSLGGSTSLNTPTLISPSQLKSGNVCFLPSPTLSPMSSVFELPSPLLVFSQSAQGQLQQTSQNANKSSESTPTFIQTNNAPTAMIKCGHQTPSPTSKVKSDPSLANEEIPSLKLNQTEETILSATIGAKNFHDNSSWTSHGARGAEPKSSSENDLDLASKIVSCDNKTQVISESNISSLITPSAHKMKISMSIHTQRDGDTETDKDEDVVAMDCVESDGREIDGDDDDLANDIVVACEGSIENNSGAYPSSLYSKQAKEDRPATVIPQIYVTEGSQIETKQDGPVSSHGHIRDSSDENSNWTHAPVQQQSKSTWTLETLSLASSSGQHFNDSVTYNQQQPQRTQRDSFAKRALSPKSFHAKATLYHYERLESSSAPPGDYQRRARPKIKTVTTDSCVELTTPRSQYEQLQQRQHSSQRSNQDQTNQSRPCDIVIPTSYQQQDHFLPHHLNHCNQERHRSPVPYQTTGSVAILPSRVGVSACRFSSNTAASGVRASLNGRSSSAEPPGNTDSSTLVHFGSLSSSSTSTFHRPGQEAGVSLGAPLGQVPQGQNHHSRGLSHSAQHLQCMASFETIGRPLVASNAPEPNRISTNQNQTPQPQHHSISVDDLDKIVSGNRIAASFSQNQQASFLLPSSNAGAVIGRDPTDISRMQDFHQQPSIQLHQSSRPFEHYQHNHQQQQQQQMLLNRNPGGHFRSSVNELDNLLNHHQASSSDALARCIDQKRFNSGCRTTGTTSFPSPVMLPSFSGHPSTVNLFGCATAGIATVVHESNTTTSGAVSAIDGGVYNSVAQQTIGGCLTSQNRLFSATNSSNSACQFDAESRSDSMSSNSLDFCPITGMDASRSSSAASSNVSAKKYHCDRCSKSFTRSDMLSRHRRLHSGDRPFQCTECKQEFSRSDHLSTHMRTHTGEKPYKCKLCSYTACRKDMITRHMKVHNRSPSSVELMDST